MASSYIFKFTDTTKADFSLSAYSTDGPRSPTDPLFLDQAIRASTTLKLYGKGMPDYGQEIEQNLIYMLENFANSSEPVYPIEGQMWYKNSTGELFIRNGSGSWDAILIVTGTSAMTGTLDLGGNLISNVADPLSAQDAASRNYVDTEISSVNSVLTPHVGSVTGGGYDVHLTADQNTLLDALDLPTLTGAEVNTLEGIDTTPGVTVQTQLDDKISRAGDAMDANADLTFNGGEIFGLPAIPSSPDAVASKLYVDNQLSSGAGGDGVLSSATWLSGVGTVGNVNDNIASLVVTFPSGPPATFLLEGITRVGHTHPGTEVTFDNTSYPLYPAEMQSVIEYIEANKADLLSPTFSGSVSISVGGTLTLAADPIGNLEAATKQYVDSVAGGGGGTSTASSTSISRELYTVPSAATLIPTIPYVADSNKLFVFLNGIKHYANTHGLQRIAYDPTVVYLDSTTLTGIDTTLTYVFDVTVDGVGPTTITLTAGTVLSTHGNLVTAINAQLALAALDVVFSIQDTDTEVFTSYSSGSASSISITNPGAGNYLFNIPAPITILRSEYDGDFTDTDSSLWLPDHIVMSGDVTTTYPAGKTFTVRGSDTDYGSYDNVYAVHVSGPSYNAGLNETWIPIGQLSNYNIAIPLLTAYSPPGSPANPTPPTVTTEGDIYFTYIGGLVEVSTAVAGADGHYTEVVSAGVQAAPGELVGYIEYAAAIPAGQVFEYNLFS